MRFSKLALLATAAVAVVGVNAIGVANAATFTVQTANLNGNSFDAVQGTSLANAITASFTYTGPLNFVNNAAQNTSSTGDLNSSFFTAANISNYVGSGSLAAPANANFTTEASFLASSGSAAGYTYGSFYTIDLGTLAKGTVLTITHDDGVSVYQSGSRIGSTTSGPTSAVTESVSLSSTADTILYYGRQNGTPSVLTVAVPEPASLALLGMGLVGVGLARRRRLRQG